MIQSGMTAIRTGRKVASLASFTPQPSGQPEATDLLPPVGHERPIPPAPPPPEASPPTRSLYGVPTTGGHRAVRCTAGYVRPRPVRPQWRQCPDERSARSHRLEPIAFRRRNTDAKSSSPPDQNKPAARALAAA